MIRTLYDIGMVKTEQTCICSMSSCAEDIRSRLRFKCAELLRWGLMTWWMASVAVRTVWISNDADKVALFQTYPTLPNNCLLPLPWIPSGCERGQVLVLYLQSINAVKLHHLLEQSNKGGPPTCHLLFAKARQRPGFSYWWNVEQSQHHHISDRELILGWRKYRCCQKSSITFMNSFLKLARSDHPSLTKESCDTWSSGDLPRRCGDGSRPRLSRQRQARSSTSTSVNKESELVWYCVLICPIRPQQRAALPRCELAKWEITP